MQRKNNILKFSHQGFAMIMAIGVIVILSTIMAFSLSMTTKTTKKTGDLYLYEQALLLSKSAAEYALLRVGLDGACSHSQFNFTHNNIYDINITLKYIYTDPSPCTDASDDYATVTVDRSMYQKGEDQNGSVLIDVTVSTNPTANVGEPIHYFSRGLWKL